MQWEYKFEAYRMRMLPWVPEDFLACGGNFRCWPKADTSCFDITSNNSSPMVKNAKKNLYVWFFWSFTPVSFYFSSWMEECFVWPWNMVFVKRLKQGVVGWGQYSIFLFACCIIFVHAFSERYHFKVKRLSLIDEFKKRNSFFVKNLT